LPEHIYDRYDIEENPKPRIARLVLNDLRQLGARRDRLTQQIRQRGRQVLLQQLRCPHRAMRPSW
jgi:hypothetical protein